MRNPSATIAIKQHGCALRRGGGGERKAPSSPPQRRNLPATKKTSTERKRLLPMLVSRAHLARQCASCGESSLGARLRTRKVTAQGRFAACDQGCHAWLFLLSWLDVEQLGRCPKPHKGRCPLTLQGTLSLDPFWAARLGFISKLSGVWCFRASFSASFESAPLGAFPP